MSTPQQQAFQQWLAAQNVPRIQQAVQDKRLEVNAQQNRVTQNRHHLDVVLRYNLTLRNRFPHNHPARQAATQAVSQARNQLRHSQHRLDLLQERLQMALDEDAHRWVLQTQDGRGGRPRRLFRGEGSANNRALGRNRVGFFRPPHTVIRARHNSGRTRG